MMGPTMIDDVAAEDYLADLHEAIEDLGKLVILCLDNGVSSARLGGEFVALQQQLASALAERGS